MKPYYQDDFVTIYHGDALELLPTFKRASFNAVLTDPPYIIGSLSAGSMASKSGGWADMMNSALWFTSWYKMTKHLLRSDGVFWSFLNWRSLPVVMRAALDAELSITSMAVWDKQWIGPGGTQGLRPSYEMVALFCQPDFSISNRGVPDIIKSQVGSYKPHGHPAEKPLNLMNQILAISDLKPGALVLDPFMGSGTTLEAAKSIGLQVVGIEAEEKYCEIAAKRCGQDYLFGEVG